MRYTNEFLNNYSCVADMCNYNMNSPTIKVVCVMIFAPMVFLAWPFCRMCQGFLLYKLWRISPGIPMEDFSGHLNSHKHEEKKSGD